MSLPSPRQSRVLSRITPGLTGTAEIVVGPEHTAPFVGSGRIAVLATPVMINVIEAAALAAVEHLLARRPSEPRHPPRRQPCRGDAGRLARHRDRRGLTASKAAPSHSASKPATSSSRSAAARHQRVVVSVARFDERVQRKLRGDDSDGANVSAGGRKPAEHEQNDGRHGGGDGMRRMNMRRSPPGSPA